MPFVSNAQRKLCFALENQAKKKGKKPAWDCLAYSKKGAQKRKVKLPEKLKKLWDNKAGKYKTVKLFRGPNGGLYYKTKSGKKKYTR